MRFAAVLRILAAGTIPLLPLRAMAHGGEFLQAKVTFTGQGGVQVDVTADYGGANPSIDNEEEAAKALATVLRVRDGGAALPLGSFSQPSFTRPAEFDPSSPYAALPGSGSESHRLLMATWSWTPAAAAIVFEIPHGTPSDVVLWTVDPSAPRRNPRWIYLVADDSTPPIPVLRRPVAGFREAAGFGAVGCCLVFPAWWIFRRRPAA